VRQSQELFSISFRRWSRWSNTFARAGKISCEAEPRIIFYQFQTAEPLVRHALHEHAKSAVRQGYRIVFYQVSGGGAAGPTRFARALRINAAASPPDVRQGYALPANSKH